MTKVLILGDSGVPSGFGRICDEVGVRLHRRGYEMVQVSLQYDGLLPPMYDGKPLPYWVASLAGKPSWIEPTMAVIQASKPDVVISCQDFPYAQQLFLAPLDWSIMGRVIITPVDGKPIFPAWMDIANQVEAVVTISEFGVQAFREQGLAVGLCRPGVNTDKFYKLPDEQRAAIRARLGIAPGAFVPGRAAGGHSGEAGHRAGGVCAGHDGDEPGAESHPANAARILSVRTG